MLLEKFSGTQVQAHSFSREAETVCRKVQAWIVLLSKVSTVGTPPGGCVVLLVMRFCVLETGALPIELREYKTSDRQGMVTHLTGRVVIFDAHPIGGCKE